METPKQNEGHVWDKFYPEDERTINVPDISLYEYICNANKERLNNLAINYFNRKWTYDDLFEEIDLCAKAFKEHGIKEGDVVTICLPNMPESVISFYALSKIGAIASMLHPLSAEEEIKNSLKNTNSVMLIAINIIYEKIKNIIDETPVRKTVIVSPRDSMPLLIKVGYYLLEDRKVKMPKTSEKYMRWSNFIAKGKNNNSDVLVKGTRDKPAVIMNSGGTTGTPKNILLSNGNINVVVRQAQISLPKFDDTDSMLSILPMFHCFGLVETIHLPLGSGASTILVPRFDAARFDKLLTKYSPTIIPGVPTLFEALLTNKHMEKVDLSYVKYVVSGGDTLQEERNLAVNEFLKEHNCTSNIVQGYGLSETSGGCVFATVGTDKLGSSGIPLVGNDLKIVDINTGERLPPNEIGEIMINTPSIMLGYLNNEKETKCVIETDEDGKQWVHTGDMGYVDEDGLLFFHERLKRLIIVSGYNVFPSHIEDILNKHESILDCCVVGKPHPYKVQVPKAFIVLKEDTELTDELKEDIKKHCEKNLARYMLPKEYVFKDELPKTMIGKVDYKVLEEE